MHQYPVAISLAIRAVVAGAHTESGAHCEYVEYIFSSHRDMQTRVRQGTDDRLNRLLLELKCLFDLGTSPVRWEEFVRQLDEPKHWLILVGFNARDGFRIETAVLIKEMPVGTLEVLRYSAWGRVWSLILPSSPVWHSPPSLAAGDEH